MWLTDCKGVANPTEAAVIQAGVVSQLIPPPANVVSGQKKKNPLSRVGCWQVGSGEGQQKQKRPADWRASEFVGHLLQP